MLQHNSPFTVPPFAFRRCNEMYTCRQRPVTAQAAAAFCHVTRATPSCTITDYWWPTYVTLVVSMKTLSYILSLWLLPFTTLYSSETMQTQTNWTHQHSIW